MTTPNQPAPAGALTDGDLSPLDGLSESAWRANLDASALSGYRAANQVFLDQASAVDNAIADLESGMLELGDRTDLLESAPAYGQRFLSQSWNISGGNTKALPFDTWLGPRKDVFEAAGASSSDLNWIGIHSPADGFEGAGLWRADLQVNFDAPPSGWFGSATVATVTAYLVIASGASIFSTRRFDLLVSSYGAQSASFSTTFVIPPELSDARVSGQVYHGRSGTIRLRGGTIDSCLSVNKWSLGTDNAVLIDNPPDGGTL